MPALFKVLDKETPEQPVGSRDFDRFGVWGSWLFWGDFGTGKSGLAAAIARLYVYGHTEDPLYSPSRVLFRSVPDMLSELRSTYGRSEGPTESAVLEKYRSVELLVLDDIGAEHVKDTGWLEDRLYQVIGQRHSDMNPIVLTSNLAPDQLGARIGERVMWRLVEMCGPDHIVHVTGPNLRDKR